MFWLVHVSLDFTGVIVRHQESNPKARKSLLFPASSIPCHPHPGDRGAEPLTRITDQKAKSTGKNTKKLTQMREKKSSRCSLFFLPLSPPPFRVTR
jgi:hypothetical protein